MSKDKIFEKFNKDRVLNTGNVSANVVNKKKKKIIQEAPKEYKEKYEDHDREKLINQLFFYESQIFYLEKTVESLQKELKGDDESS